MRKSLLPLITVSALALASTLASAADLPSRRAPPVFAPPPPIPTFTWTGVFGGLNAGVAFDQRNGSGDYYFPAGSIANSTGTAGLLSIGGNNNRTSFAGGGQIGFNYEIGSSTSSLGILSGVGNAFNAVGGGLGGGFFGPSSGIVIGAVADAQYLDSANRDTNGGNYTFTPNTPLTVGNAFVSIPGLPTTNVNTSFQRTNFFGTVRGRLGVAIDRVLVYGTGGLAYDTHTTGYTYGGGLEYGITNNITVGAEYLRVNLNRGQTYSAVYVPDPGLGAGNLYLTSRGGTDTFSVARGFINYKLDVLNPVPVVARY